MTRSKSFNYVLGHVIFTGIILADIVFTGLYLYGINSSQPSHTLRGAKRSHGVFTFHYSFRAACLITCRSETTWNICFWESSSGHVTHCMILKNSRKRHMYRHTFAHALSRCQCACAAVTCGEAACPSLRAHTRPHTHWMQFMFSIHLLDLFFVGPRAPKSQIAIAMDFPSQGPNCREIP